MIRNGRWRRGGRSGGRRLIRRISKLPGIFGEGRDSEMVRQEVGVTCSETILSSLLNLTSLSRGRNSTHYPSKENKKHAKTQLLLVEDSIVLEGCDW